MFKDAKCTVFKPKIGLFWANLYQNSSKILRISVGKFSGERRIEISKFSGFLHPENSGSQPYFSQYFCNFKVSFF